MYYGVKSSCCGPGESLAWRQARDQETTHPVPVDVFENKEGEYVIRASLPGFRREDVQVEFEDGVLTIAATRHEDRAEGAAPTTRYYLQERAQGRFERRIQFEKASGEAIRAELKDGVLTVTLAQLKEAQPRSITIE